MVKKETTGGQEVEAMGEEVHHVQNFLQVEEEGGEVAGSLAPQPHLQVVVGERVVHYCCRMCYVQWLVMVRMIVLCLTL